MNVLYDHQAFTFQYFGGVSKCFCKLISHLPKEVSAEIAIAQSNNVHLRQAGLCPNVHPVSMDWMTFDCSHHFKGKWHLYRFMNRLFINLPTTENINLRYSIERLKSGGFDVFHPTFFDDYFLPYLNGKPFVLTVHDMMPELFPQYF